MNKIAAVSMMKNEADIVESFARHVLKIADLLIVTDHNSTDKTRSILESLQSEGLPIIIYSFDSIEHRQEEIINEMTRQAIELGADIILPLDADEFIIKLDGNSEDVRRIFQNLDSNECYTITWWNFGLLDPEKDQDKFLLSRPLAFTSKNYMKKVIVGSRAYLENDLYVIRGNHNVVKKSEVYGNWYRRIVSVNLDDSLHLINLHVPSRSYAQVQSKKLTLALTQTAAFSEFGYYGQAYKQMVEDFLNGEKVSVEAEPNSPVFDLSQYQNECVLKYTDGRVDTLQNIYRVANDLAGRYSRLRTLIQKIPVSIFVLHYGNAKDTISTLDSIFKQTYEPIEIFVMPIVENELDVLISRGSNFSKSVRLIDYNLKTAVENSQGTYLQFITAGDILQPETVEDLTCIIDPQNSCRTVIPIPKTVIRLPDDNRPFRLSLANSSYEFFTFANLMKALLENNLLMNIGISNIFYRREFLPESLKFFIDENRDAHVNLLLYESIYHGLICVLQKDLIDRKSTKIPWTDEDRKIFEQDMFVLRSIKLE